MWQLLRLHIIFLYIKKLDLPENSNHIFIHKVGCSSSAEANRNKENQWLKRKKKSCLLRKFRIRRKLKDGFKNFKDLDAKYYQIFIRSSIWRLSYVEELETKTKEAKIWRTVASFKLILCAYDIHHNPPTHSIV